MKTFLFLIAFIATAITSSAQIRMMVMSDPHVMESSLYDTPYGSAFIKAMQADLKVVEYSQQLFSQFADRVIKEKPQLLLIPGDMTKDGELVSHLFVAQQLADIEAAGVKVYVIPGNHDMENPYAYSFRGNKKEKVPTVSEEEFREIYRDFGYGEAVSMDTLTGSYMVYPNNELAIVCINSNIRNNNKARYVHGRISHSTLNWMENAAAMAHREKRYVMAMVHHEVMQHHSHEDLYAPTAMTNMERIKGMPQLKDVQNAFARAGIQVVLTGHYHIQSVKEVNTLFGKLTDISTGSLSGFPSPFRYMTLEKNGKLHVTSATMFGNNTSRWPATDWAKKEMERLRYMMQLYIPKLPGVTTNYTLAYSCLGNTLNKVLCALASGDEHKLPLKNLFQESIVELDSYVRQAMNYNVVNIEKVKHDKNGAYVKYGEFVHSIMNNYVDSKKNNSNDNNVTITLKK